ncbi:MAG: PKD domain-containing protein, partial [bacterium]
MTHGRFFALFALVVTLGFSSTSAAPTRGATHGGNSELTSGLARWMTRLVQDAMQSAVLQGDATLPDHWFGPGPLHKVWVRADEHAVLSEIEASGALLRTLDYGAFAVAVVDEERVEGGREALEASGYRFRDELDLMVLNGFLLNGQRPQDVFSRLDPAERFGDESGRGLDPQAGLYIVQFAGPVRDEWVQELDTFQVGFRQYLPMNAYVIDLPADQVYAFETYALSSPDVQFVSAYEPAFKLHPVLRRALAMQVTEPMRVTVQLVDGDGIRAALAELGTMLTDVQSARVVGPYVNVRAYLHPLFFQTLAVHPRVFQIEPMGDLEGFDEAQGQIVAGNVSGNSPTGPGYLSWLSSQGFGSSQFGTFSVNVVDDATSLSGHADLPSSRVPYELNPSGQTGSQGGHGFLNAHIVGGFNNGTGSAFEDGSGYNYGLGIAPWARVGSTAIFGPGGVNPTSYEDQAYGLGARISSNSWGFTSGGQPIPDYDSNAQEFDIITRDARSGTAGNQEYFVVFAAGNSGSGSNTVSTPGTAKNILTLAAGENVRQTGSDGCGIGNSGANSLNDIISFSSRGPVNSSGGDGRWKPELTAPGTHIQAGVPQSNYNGSSVCNQYWPSGQTLYGWSSGTSHSCPAAAGGAALVYQWFLNQGLSAPSPAMLKATLVTTAEFMTGVGANDTLPSNSQGSGLMDLGRAFDGVASIREDQGQLLTASGQSYQVTGNVDNPSAPFRVALVWTDPAGPTSGAPYVNDLNLMVTVGGSTYLGNVFSGQNSTTGGSADIRNNTELVFLPAGASGSFTVTVTGASIGGDGLPGNGDSTDQDFALLIYNGSSGPPVSTAAFTGSPQSGDHPLTVAFTDLSTGSPTSWAWDFGDGSTSSTQNPSHVYTAAGSYTVSLDIVTPTGSDNETKVGYITVSDPPPPGIQDGSFEGQTQGSAPASPWAVDFGTGHVIAPGTATTSDGGLPSDGTNWADLSAAGTNNATPPSNPGGVTNPPAGGAGISQSFSYGTSVTLLSFDAAFLRNETANSTFNDWMSVDVSDGSTWYNLYFADTTTPTVGTSAIHGYAMTAVSNVSIDLLAIFPSSTTSTTFTLTAQVGNAVDSIQSSVGYVDNFAMASTGPVGPTAEFSGTPTSGTAPLTVAFSDLSTGDVTGWSWDFGDGGSSSAQNPSHTYSVAGTYTVALTVTGAGGTDTATKVGYITVNEPPPTADFSGTPTSGDAPLVVAFSDASTGNVISWSWAFGDGGSSSSQNPSHTYLAAGTYTVSLTATGAGGSDTSTKVG